MQVDGVLPHSIRLDGLHQQMAAISWEVTKKRGDLVHLARLDVGVGEGVPAVPPRELIVSRAFVFGIVVPRGSWHR